MSSLTPRIAAMVRPEATRQAFLCSMLVPLCENPASVKHDVLYPGDVFGDANAGFQYDASVPTFGRLARSWNRDQPEWSSRESGRCRAGDCRRRSSVTCFVSSCRSRTGRCFAKMHHVISIKRQRVHNDCDDNSRSTSLRPSEALSTAGHPAGQVRRSYARYRESGPYSMPESSLWSASDTRRRKNAPLRATLPA